MTLVFVFRLGTLTMNVMTVSHVNYDLTEFECDTASPLDGEFDAKSKSFQVCDVFRSTENFRDFLHKLMTWTAEMLVY